MSEEDENPFDGFGEQEADNAVWVAVAALLALLVLAFVCWLAP